jgi:penicillin-binding protein 1A
VIPALRGRRTALAAVAGVAAMLLAAWAGVFAWGNGDAGRAFLKDRALKALRARLGPVEVGEARLDLLLRARLGPVTMAGSRQGGAPLLRAETVIVRPRLVPLLAGRVEPASVLLRGVHLAPGPGGEDLRSAVERGGAGPRRPGSASLAAPLPSVHLRRLFLDLPAAAGRPAEEVGPFDVDIDVRRGTDGLAGVVRLGLPGGGALHVELTRSPGGAGLRAEGAASLPDDLPAALARRLPFSVDSGSIRIRATGRAAEDLASGSLDAEVRAIDLSLAGPRIGAIPIRPIAWRASGHMAWDFAARRVAIENATITLGGSGEVAAAVAGEASFRGEPRFSISARAGAVPWHALVDALPPDLAPPSTAPPVSGTLSARASISGPLARRGEWDVQVDVDLDDLRRASRAAGPTWLSSGFEWRPIDPASGEPERRIAVGPGNPAFIPYAEVPQTMVRAVTASEDGGFFGHRGFDFREIAKAVVEPGRVRGASTISQQLSKNLFLSPERTLARKVREALGTVALEANLSKARLLEIYLNIAEWGPGVYGLGEAARFWFGKDARDLTPRESAFLATVIPSPRRFHARLHRSGITPWWNARIDDVLRKMRIQNQLSDEQLASALLEPLAPLSWEHPPGSGDAGAGSLGEPEPDEDGDGPASGRPSDPSPPIPPR